MNELEQFKFEKNIGIYNLTDDFFALLIKKTYIKDNNSILIVTPTMYEASNLYFIISEYIDNCYLYETDEYFKEDSLAISPDLMISRLNILNNAIISKKMVVITDVNGYFRTLPSRDTYISGSICLKSGTIFNKKSLIEKLILLGYKSQTLVSKIGEYGERGFVLDVFPLNTDNPIRIEFFDDEIESIKYFDSQTQKTICKIDDIVIRPFTEFITKELVSNSERKQKYLYNYGPVESLPSYFQQAYIFYKDFHQIKIVYEMISNEIYKRQINNAEKYLCDFSKLDLSNCMYYFSLNNFDIKENKYINFNIKNVPEFNNDIAMIKKFISEKIKENKKIIVCLNENYQIKNLDCLNFLIKKSNMKNLKDGVINILQLKLRKGFENNEMVFLAPYNLFGTKLNKHKKSILYKDSVKITDIQKLNIGDYVVHSLYGIGIYNGIKTLSQLNVRKDYLEVLYLGKDKLYVPADKIDYISKYSGKEGTIPKINKLGSQQWEKTKQRVREKVKNIAHDILRIQAERKMKRGFSFSPDNPLQEQFENEFEYELTDDQKKSIYEIKKDMESSAPMDRILCGDVGYGKTEVAFRAMFKAVMDSKQVLYLCPTTLLSKQQYENALKRFQNFPINIELLNRFVSKQKQKKILQKLKEKKVDILFGTHRILSKDIITADLGLLVIDEEQRFGVTHKEQIKKYKSNIDVLTLTATPIPRTLQLSLMGLKSLSLITTPPHNRYAIQTYVIEENAELIKDIILKELYRKGQTFILYNRVEDIEMKLNYIKRLVPEARIIYAHGQMNKDQLENAMIKFINYDYDVLLCTTIIETGIDIPNVNSLIILDANCFGLSQLYQIRGRVGRADKVAYAYLMYNKNKLLTETAQKRLNAIKEYTELGSGFSISTRDLSIRGAGDVLGSEQAGFIDTVGIELYLKLLQNEINILQGKAVEENELDNSEKWVLNVNSYINNNYICDNDLKLEIHKKINSINNYDDLVKTKQELEDRFGKIDEALYEYMNSEWLEKIMKKVGVIEINDNVKNVELIFSEEASKKIDYQNLFSKSLNISSNFSFKYVNNRFLLSLEKKGLEKSYIFYLIELLKGM